MFEKKRHLDNVEWLSLVSLENTTPADSIIAKTIPTLVFRTPRLSTEYAGASSCPIPAPTVEAQANVDEELVELLLPPNDWCVLRCEC
jgi:hypothetical protein